MFAIQKEVLSDLSLKILQGRAAEVEWEAPVGRYHTADVSHQFPNHKRAFFLKLPAGTGIHRHRDAGDVQTDHIVVATNPQCLSWWEEDGAEKSMHMELGHRYTVERTLLHWAHNGGETDRIHLLLEY